MHVIMDLNQFKSWESVDLSYTSHKLILNFSNVAINEIESNIVGIRLTSGLFFGNHVNV